MRRTLSSVVAVTAILSACVSFGLMGSDASAADGTPATPLPASKVQVTKDVTYTEADGTTPDPRRVRSPRRRPPTGPAVVLIHGGAWGSGQANDLDHRGQAHRPRRAGWPSASTTAWPTRPRPPWPDELTDVQRATRWVGANAVDVRRRQPEARRSWASRPAVTWPPCSARSAPTVDGTGAPDRGPEPAGQGRRRWPPGRRRPRLAGLVARRGRRPARLHRQQEVRPVLAPAARQELPRLPARRSARQVLRPGLAGDPGHAGDARRSGSPTAPTRSPGCPRPRPSTRPSPRPASTTTSRCVAGHAARRRVPGQGLERR